MEIDTIEIEFIDNGYVFTIHGWNLPVGPGRGTHKEQKDFYFKTLSEGFEYIKDEYGLE